MVIKKSHLIYFFTYIFFVLMYIEETLPAGQLFTFGSIAVMVAIYYSTSQRQLVVNGLGYLSYIFIFLCFVALSMLWAIEPMRTFSMVRRLILILIVITSLCMCLYKSARVDALLKVIMYGGYTVVFYAIAKYGLHTVLSSLSDGERITNEFLNANRLGMAAAYAILINVYFILDYKRITVMDSLALPAILVIAASESRKAIVIMGGGVLAIFLLKCIRDKNLKNAVFKIVLVLLAFVTAVILMMNLPMFAGLKTRMLDLVKLFTGNYTRKTSGFARLRYNKIGKELFLKHPLLGIGIANAGVVIEAYSGHQHLHNNFIEMLACGGIIGFIINYSIYGYLFYEYIKHWKNDDNVFDLCLVIMLIRFVMGYGYIQYFEYDTYFYLMVMVIEINRIRNNSKNKEQILYGMPKEQMI